jgi:hypothetical protein
MDFKFVFANSSLARTSSVVDHLDPAIVTSIYQRSEQNAEAETA